MSNFMSKTQDISFENFNTYENPERYDLAEGAWERHHTAEVGDVAAYVEPGLAPWMSKPDELATGV